MRFSFAENATAEYAVIGDLLIDDRCFPVILEVLPNADFFDIESCRKAYIAALKLHEEGKAIDPVTIERLTDVGREFLRECMDITPTAVNAADHAAAVLDCFRRRQAAEVAQELLDAVQDKGTVIADALAAACSKLAAITDASARKTVHSSAACMEKFLVHRQVVQSGNVTALKSGFPSIDAVLGGFTLGGLYLIAARPGVGKSGFAIALADMLAKSLPVLYVSAEMNDDELSARRIAAAGSGSATYSRLLFAPARDDNETADLCSTAAKLSERKLFTSAVSETTVSEIGLQAEAVHAAVIVVDYIGLLKGTNPRANEYERVSEISTALKRLAKRRNCVVLALAQLNRDSVATGKHEPPKLSQLRSSGQLEQDADGVLLLDRPDYGESESTRPAWEAREFDVDIAKNRHGRTGLVKLDWYPAVNRFMDGDVQSWV